VLWPKVLDLGARSEPIVSACASASWGLCIVIDEQRRHGAKAARPPLRVVQRSALGVSHGLHWQPSPRFTALLPSALR
jgi:hypothetical protein